MRTYVNPDELEVAVVVGEVVFVVVVIGSIITVVVLVVSVVGRIGDKLARIGGSFWMIIGKRGRKKDTSYELGTQSMY